jgi:hypothetical protein
MISKDFEKLCKYIILVYDTDIKYEGEFIPVLFKHKYSSSPNETIRLKLDNQILPIKGMKVKYSCPNCSNISDILMKRFLHKKTIKCISCREDSEKRISQSNYIKNCYEKHGKVKKKDRQFKKFNDLSSYELIKISNDKFGLESETFKTNYWEKVPTLEQFNKLKNKIKIDDINMDNVIYYPHIKTNHSHKYSPKILDECGKLHLLSKLTFKCDFCGDYFDGRNFKEKSLQYKLLCKDCLLCNKTFKIRNTKNIKNESVIYQSKPELDLIKYCNLNSILIENGPKIDYYYNNKKLRYKVDFKIKNILIEIKDFHIWHKIEVESGKWERKESAAKEYCKNNNLEYKLIMKSDIKNLKDYIVRYQWIILK